MLGCPQQMIEASVTKRRAGNFVSEGIQSGNYVEMDRSRSLAGRP